MFVDHRNHISSSPSPLLFTIRSQQLLIRQNRIFHSFWFLYPSINYSEFNFQLQVPISTSDHLHVFYLISISQKTQYSQLMVQQDIGYIY